MRKILAGVEVAYQLRPEYDLREHKGSVARDIFERINEDNDALFHLTKEQYRAFVAEANAMTSTREEWDIISDVISDAKRFEIYG